MALKDFDPRPLEYRRRPGYRDLFRGIWLNSSATNPPIRQLYAPANMYGVALDHDYEAKMPQDSFLDKIHVTTMTTEQQASIEEGTRGQSTNKHWKEERLLRLQSSMYGRICKATDRTDFHKLAESLIQIKDITTEPIKHGRKFEATARDAYANKNMVSVSSCGIFVSMDKPFLGCSPDGLVGESGLLEIKCPFTAKDKLISPATVSYLHEDIGGKFSLDVNHDYYYQVMGAMFCTGRQWCDFVVWTMKDMKEFRIKRDEHFIDNMTGKLSSFFENYYKPVVLDKYFFKHTDEFLPVK